MVWLDRLGSSQNSSVTYSQAPPSLLSLPIPSPATAAGTAISPIAMAASRRHAQLVLLLLLDLSLFCTFARCTVLTFARTDNSITLRCVSDLQNQFAVPNANFFVRTTESSRQFVRDFTPRQNSHEIMFTLTPETEGNFSCQNPATTNEFSGELLLAGELPRVTLKIATEVSPTLSTPISPTKKIKLCHLAYSNKNNFFC